MPEGDTVWRTARRLHQALAGAPVTVCDLRWPSLATVDLRGATTAEVVSRGKHLLHRLDTGLTLHSHLRMEGQWQVAATAAGSEHGRQRGPLRHGADVRALVGTDTWTAVGLRLGMLNVVDTGEEQRLVGHLGPDLLGPDWDPETATANLTASTAPLGAALLDQRNLAGLGTLWASEALFLERLGPWLVSADVDAGRLASLVARSHRLLDRGRHHALQSSTGVPRDGANTYVHGRSGRPCRRCGETVRLAMVGAGPRARTMFYCPACQGGMGPTDDGRPQRPLGSAGGRRSPRG